MSAALHFKPPSQLNFEGNIAKNYKEWIRAWDIYATAIELKKKDETIQVASFLHVAGPAAQSIFDTFTLTEDEKNKLADVKNSFKEYCEPKKNVSVCRLLLDSRKQKPGEKFADFLTALKTLMKDCEYGTMENELLRDKIVFGILDDQVRMKLLRTDGLDLKKCIDTCTIAEITTSQMKEAQAAVIPNTAEVNYVKTKKDPHQSKGQSRYKQPAAASRSTPAASGLNSSKCTRCPYQHEPSKCPARGKTCNYCHKIGHFAESCQRRLWKKEVQDIQAEEDEQYIEILDDFSIDNIMIVDSVRTSTSDWHQTCKVEGYPVNFKLDSGSQVDIIPESIFNQLSADDNIQVAESQYSLRSYSNHVIKPVGQVTLDVKLGSQSQSHPVRFQIVRHAATPILGKNTCADLDLLQRKLVDDVTRETGDNGDFSPSNPNSTNHRTSQISQSPPVQSTHQSPDNNVSNRRHTSINVTVDRNASQNAVKIMREMKHLFEGLGELKGRQYDIAMDPMVPPTQNPPRTIPYKLRDNVFKELQRMETLGVIEKVTEPSAWISSMTVVAKPNGSIRLCLDPRELNKAIQRQHYPMKTIEEITAGMPDATVFSKFDATSGYWQLKLTDKSSHLTCFNTPFGRYKYLRLPFGISSAGEIWQRAMIEEFGDLEGVEVIVDDVLIWGRNNEEHDARLQKFLKRVEKIGLKLNRKKCVVGANQVEYVGHLLTSSGLQPSPDRIKVLTELPEPQNQEELQSVLGIMVYLSKFVPNLSEITAPLRGLLEKGVEWHWYAKHQKAFREAIEIATKAPVLRYYDVTKEVTVATDASNQGFGAVIIQEQRPVAYASRKVAPAERNYATIEKEMSAILYGCTKFHDYIFAKPTVIETDHKPLVGIFDKPLYKLSPRLQRMRMQLMRYDLTVRYKPGKEMFIPDALSRFGMKDESSKSITEDIAEVHCVMSQYPASDPRISQIRQLTLADPVLQALKQAIMSGWPSKYDIADSIRPYYHLRDDIVCCDGLLMLGNRIIMPAAIRPEMLAKLHQAHQGVVKSKQRARTAMYWPGINSQIEDTVGKCSVCQEMRPQQAPQPLVPHDIPHRPWSKVGVDLFCFNGDWLAVVDYYSKFPEIVKLRDTSSHSVIQALKQIFSRFGVPNIVMSDNGPQFSSEAFKTFAQIWKFEQKTSSPLYAQSNGQVENTVKTVKRILKKAAKSGEDPHLMLLEYRNTPIDGVKYSPAQMLNSRALRSALIPTADNMLKPQTIPEVTDQLKQRQEIQKYYFDNKGVINHKPVDPGVSVRFKNAQNEWQFGNVVNSHNSPRSYVVKNQNEKVYRRNRKHLFVTKESPPAMKEELEQEIVSQPQETQETIESPVRQGIEQSKCPRKVDKYYESVQVRDEVVTSRGRISKPKQLLNMSIVAVK